VRRFRGEFEQAIEAARQAAPGPLDDEADRVPPPLAVGA
jgi:hypothetical protein